MVEKNSRPGIRENSKIKCDIRNTGKKMRVHTKLVKKFLGSRSRKSFESLIAPEAGA